MAGNGKKVLLHACCGPCSIMCIQSLRDEGYDVTGYFANPNIHPVSEYFRRREAMEQVAEQMDLPMLWQDDVYDLPGWLKMVHDLGIADNQGYARHQQHDAIRGIGTRVAASGDYRSDAGFGSEFLYRDFRPLWQAGIDRSKEMGLYRQNYCACIFSEYERFEKKLRKL